MKRDIKPISILLPFILLFSILFLLFISSGKSPENIILITANSLRADRLSCYGYSFELTPNIYMVANEGTMFRNMYAQSSSPPLSAASLLAFDHFTTIRDKSKIASINSTVTTGPEILRDGGFTTAAFIADSSVAAVSGISRGFNEFYNLTSVSSSRSSTGTLTRRASEWLESNSGNNFFLMIIYPDPAHPYLPPYPYDMLFSATPPPDSVNEIVRASIPPSEKQLADIRYLYDGEVKYLDNQIGTLLNTLDELNLTENTLIIITSMNGEEFHEHGGWKNSHTLYDELLMIPLLLKGPGIPEKTISEFQAQQVDIMPTILDLAGIKTDIQKPGTSLAPYFEMKSSDENRLIYHSLITPGRRLFAVRKGSWKYILDRNTKTEQLFNLADDPHEKENLISGYYTVRDSGKREAIARNIKQLRENMNSLFKNSAGAGKKKTIPVKKKKKEALDKFGYIE